MDSYKFTLNETKAILKQWLVQNNCPKASKTVTTHGTNSTFVVEGNISAVSMWNAFDQIGYDFKVEPVGNSKPLPNISVIYT